jgi:hypothetical protein
MFMYNSEYIFTSVLRPPQNVLFSLFGDVVTLPDENQTSHRES